MKRLDQIILRPIVTEKSADAMAQRKYTFLVRSNVTKLDVKEAVEKIFSVRVDMVRTLNIRPHRKGGSRNSGKTPERKKAIVTLEENQKIPSLEVQG